MKTYRALDPVRFAELQTAELRASFLVTSLFRPGRVQWNYWETDRTLIGSAVPLSTPLALDPVPGLAMDSFLARRELGVINLGGPGRVEVDGMVQALGPRDGSYIGRGVRRVRFHSVRSSDPARFYLLSYPAHAEHPSVIIPRSSVPAIELGSSAGANVRRLYKYIHPDGVRSGQLVMGCTELAAGSVWNTIPPHTHARRSEVYLYYDIPDGQTVLHLAGPPQQTRHLFVHNRQAVLSPPWSIHAGAGTAAYGFVWGMGGENQNFSDMDPVSLRALR